MFRLPGAGQYANVWQGRACHEGCVFDKPGTVEGDFCWREYWENKK